jgi:hypothetical protein
MSPEDRVTKALRSPEPVPALRALVEDLGREGNTRTEIYGMLEKFLVQLRTQPDFAEGDEEAVLDVMDALAGWCHPSAELLPEKPAR